MVQVRARSYKILVQDSGNCVDVAHYINENIQAINRAGVKIRMEKLDHEDLDEEQIDRLRRRGISRLPAMIGGQKPIIGRDNIISALRQQVRAPAGGGGTMPGGGIPGSGSTVGDFWMREMFSGARDDKGALIPNKDDDDNGIGDVAADIERRMRDYETGKIPPHRRQDVDQHGRPQPAAPQQRPPAQPQYHPGDNISQACLRCESDPCECGSTGNTSYPQYQQSLASLVGGDDVDSMMMSALLNNTADYDDV